jgi:hypothetical protein
MNWKIGLLAAVVTVAVVIAGCVYGPKRVTFNTLSGAEIGVDVAMQGWGDYVKQFHPTPAQEQQVADAYQKYQAAEDAAIDAARFTITVTSGSDTNAITAAQSKQSAATLQASQALADLIALLRQFGVKI